MNAGSTSGGYSRHFSLRRRRRWSRSSSSNPLCMATHNRPNGFTRSTRKARSWSMSGDMIVTVTLNAALHVAYTADAPPADALLVPGGTTPRNLPRTEGPTPPYPPEDIIPVSRPGYRAGGRGVTVARVLRAFGHDVLAAGLAGGASGELIVQDLARSGVPTAFTLIRGESRRFFRFAGPDGPTQRFSEPGPYITTEELGRFAADYRRLMAGAAAVVLCGSLPDGLPADTYGSLVTYA